MTDKSNGPDWVEDAKQELTGIAKEGMKHPGTKPLLAGSAIGALGGWLLIGGPVVGGLAGAALAIYSRVKK